MGLIMSMGLSMKRFTMTALAFGVVQAVSAQVAVTQIVPKQTTQGTELRISFNGLPVQPKAYQLDNPSRLVLDFDGAANGITAPTVAVNTKEVSAVDVQSDKQRSRVVVNLKDYSTFTTKSEGNTLVLKVASSTAGQAVNLPSNVAASTHARIGVENVAFSRGGKGEGLINVDLASAQTPVDVQQQGSKIVIRFMGTKLPAHLIRKLNVTDFATPVRTVDAYNEGSSGVVVIQPSGSYDYMAYQSNDKLTVSVKQPADKNGVGTRKKETYTGRKISIDFQDIEVRRVLQLLANFTDTNIAASDAVQGNITIRLMGVPWDQALDIILRTKNLDKRKNGNVIWVAPVAELIKAEEDEAKALAQSIKLAPIQTDYIQLKYAKVADIQKLITDRKNISTSGNGQGSGTGSDDLAGNLLSPRGSVSSDARTNTLIVSDTANKIDEIRRMVELLDVPVRQVLVEARIVRATDSFAKDIGVKWGAIFGGHDIVVSGQNSYAINNGNLSVTTNSTTVDLGLNKSTDFGQIAFGLIGLKDFVLDLQLSASQSEGLAEVISTPKVLTADKQKAVIKSGQEVGYTTTTISNGVATNTVSYKEVVLKLDVTPSITPDGKVIMDLDISKDAIAGYSAAGDLLLAKNQITTNVLVGDGQTVVLGGVFEDTTSNTLTKIPFLGDLPYIGKLFRKTSKSTAKDELLIFITPRIVNENATANR